MVSTVRTLEIVIPVFNEADSLPPLFERLCALFAASTAVSARYLFVDDGSSDATANFIADKIRAGAPATLIRLSRNFGHQAAIGAGLDYADADVIAIIDGDLQDPPELLPEMLAKIDLGFDVVYGVRRSRQESAFRKLGYWLFYRFYAALSEIHVPVDAGDFCMMTRPVQQALLRLPEKLRFHRGLRSWVGFRHGALPYDRPKRMGGNSKYTFAMLYALATNGVTSLSIRPLRIMQVILFFSLLLTLAVFSFVIDRFFLSAHPTPQLSWLFLAVGLIVLTSSLQIFCLYLLGAYLGRMYIEVKGRPPYIVMETLKGPSAT